MSQTNLPQRSQMASFERFDGEMIVVKSDEAVMRVLNPVGAFIFERLDGRMNLNDLVQAITETFAVSPEVATADLERFIEDLSRRGLLAADRV
ncbi:MAG: PqqD family protein [Myxococcota bacterium]|nr:PqqD family protein [Myxococcota bacterium]